MHLLAAIFLYFLFTILVLTFAFIALFYKLPFGITHKIRCRKLPLAPKMNFLFGIGLQVIRLKQSELMDYIDNLQKEVGPLLYAEILGIPGVLLMDPEDIQLVLNSSHHITKGYEYTPLLPWLCEGLLTSTGPKWHFRRKMLTPTFHFKILDTFIPVFNKNAKLLTEKLTNCAVRSVPVDIDSYCTLCTLDIICETAMGTSLDFQLGEATEYVNAIRKAGEIVLKRNLKFWMYSDWLFYLSPSGREFCAAVKQLHRFTENVIKERKETHEPTTLTQPEGVSEKAKSKQRRSFLDCLLDVQRENPNEMTDRGIREEVDTFMFEGYDTTSVALSWALFMIAIHNDVQDKVHEEIQNIFGDSDREATYQDLQKLTYLEMVIKESLRLYPSVPYLSRTLSQDLQIRNYTIPAATNITMVPYLIHRNPTVYPEPEKFIPERFLPENCKERHPFAYIPFSAGYRNCIGQKFAILEEKVVLSTILRKLRITSDMRREDLSVLPQMILRPSPKIILKFYTK